MQTESQRFSRFLIAALVLSIGLLATSGRSSADRDDPKMFEAAQKDVVALARSIEGGKIAPGQVAAIRNKYELMHVMEVYKPRAKGGLGIRSRGKPDSIELVLISLAHRPLSREQLQAERVELIQKI